MGTKLILWTCNGKTSQKWSFRVDGTIANRSNGLAVDVTDGATANGSKVQLWTPLGDADQVWSRAQYPGPGAPGSSAGTRSSWPAGGAPQPRRRRTGRSGSRPEHPSGRRFSGAVTCRQKPPSRPAALPGRRQ
ncbi:hypothetical protein J2X68_002767 [Streptomyces sp. 3330]|uniref:RICIN domain-containing protein n=1 Tax=Streptomyces sp. 3330 TaxID=2817755 RepID=UPI00286221CE|nr:RICIN domain-containing protein [Streptomyces sp. 3330]MDR6976079.1 hypothetical protein [Streptomyces sp. 3330]